MPLQRWQLALPHLEAMEVRRECMIVEQDEKAGTCRPGEPEHRRRSHQEGFRHDAFQEETVGPPNNHQGKSNREKNTPNLPYQPKHREEDSAGTRQKKSSSWG